jgi:hypothetical protein
MHVWSGTLAAGDVLELYGASGSAKTELVYQCVVACVVPASWDGFTLSGQSQACLIIDCDCRFNVPRLRELVCLRLRAELEPQLTDQGV